MCFEKKGPKCSKKMVQILNVLKKWFKITNVSKKMIQDFKCFEKNGYRFLNEKYQKNYGEMMDDINDRRFCQETIVFF